MRAWRRFMLTPLRGRHRPSPPFGQSDMGRERAFKKTPQVLAPRHLG
jgi:hypothetical protein